MMETIQEILNFSVGKRSNQSIDGSNRKTAG